MKICPVCSREFPAESTRCPDDAVALVALNTGAKSRPEELVGQTVDGRWKIDRIIGKGGMGTVYACRHVVVGKDAAMKVLKPGVERSEGVLQRFVREAQTANLLKSRHITETTDFGQLPNGSFYVVMELLEGTDLTRAMRSGRLGRAELLHIFEQVAEALALAHDRGIVHRDLKPDNVFLVDDDGDPLFVKLLDFGIAKILHGEATGLTETGVILGTPYYMSPEQARADPIDHRTDIYALGVMLYRAFTGKLPFVADSTMGVLTRHLTEAPVPPSSVSKVDIDVERIILRCLEKEPAARYPDMREVAAAIRAISHERPMLRDNLTSDERGSLTASGSNLPMVDSGRARLRDSMSPDPRRASWGAGVRSTLPSANRGAAMPSVSPASGELATGRGFATTSSHTLSRGRSAWTVIGAAAMVGAGAALAFGVYGKMSASHAAGAGDPSAPAAVTASPAPAAQSSSPPPTVVASAAQSADSPAPSATSSASPPSSASPDASGKAHAEHAGTTKRPRPQPAAPAPPTAAPPKHLPTEIRNPFD